MHDFRDNAATFLLATPSASRGLDLPAVSHVYNLSCPDVTTYLHQAGRAGRIGSPVEGEPSLFMVIFPLGKGRKCISKYAFVESCDAPKALTETLNVNHAVLCRDCHHYDSR